MFMTRMRWYHLIAFAWTVTVLPGCAFISPAPVAEWTPPVETVTTRATGDDIAILPSTATLVPVPTATTAPTATPTRANTPTAVPPTRALTPTAAPTLALAPTADPHLFVVTEEEIAASIAGGAGAQEGLTVKGLGVQFSDDKILVVADSLGYGFVQVQNLRMVGRLVAVEGRLQMEIESITPRGLVTALIPTIANQALSQYASAWYIEAVSAKDGRLEVRIR